MNTQHVQIGPYKSNTDGAIYDVVKIIEKIPFPGGRHGQVGQFYDGKVSYKTMCGKALNIEESTADEILSFSTIGSLNEPKETLHKL